METLTTMLRKYASIHPDRLAVVDDKGGITYKVLNERVNQWCNFLIDKGVSSGISVMMYMDNQVEYLEVFLALVKINAKIIPLNIYYQQLELEYLLEQNPTAIMIADKTFYHTVEKSFKNKGNTLLYVEDIKEKQIEHYYKHFDPEEEFSTPLLFFTSGTTGRPKGIVVKPKAFILQVPADYYRENTDFYFITRSLFFRSHLTLAISILQEGKTLVLTTNKTPENMWLVTHKYSVHQMISGPSDLTSLADWLDENHKSMPETLEMVMTTGNPISYLLKKRLMKQMPHTSFIDFYGTSEVGGISSIDETEWINKHGSVGKPSFFVKCLIINEKGEEVANGEVGEICIASQYTMQEYLDNAVLNKKTFMDDFVRTGDYGSLDSEQYLFLSGRKQDEINHGGFSFYSSEVEDVLIRGSGVKEVIVLGKKNEAYGQRPIAYLVIDKQSTKGEVIAAVQQKCEKNLPSFKRPVFYHVLKEIPLTSAGKPNRVKLLTLTEMNEDSLIKT